MGQAATTTLSSKGQVVIPEEIRSRMGLKAGTQFVVLAEGDVVIFKVLDPPKMGEFDTLVRRARRAAKQAGRSKSDVDAAIAKTRGAG